MIEVIFQGNEDINEGLAKLLAAEVERLAAGMTNQGEWTERDLEIVMRALAKSGLRPGETLEKAIIRGIDARVGAHKASSQMYVADKEGFFKRVDKKRDLPGQAEQTRQ
jgi:hypothetical protein